MERKAECVISGFLAGNSRCTKLGWLQSTSKTGCQVVIIVYAVNTSEKVG